MAENGKQVTIIEMLPELAVEMNVVSRISLLGKLAAAGVNMVPGHMIKEFRADGVLAADGEGNDHLFPADSVIMAMGMKSDNALADKLKEEVDELYIIGDCVKPSKVGEAVHTGYTAGWRI
jgi:2-enoate reductase